jgi:flagellar hook-associated protein 2
MAVSGLASGMDWTTTVNELIANERSGMEDPLTTQEATLSSQLSSLTSIQTALQGLQSAADTLKQQTSDYYARKVTLAGNTATTTSNLSATADGTTPLGTYTFNVKTLATATTLHGAQIGEPLTDATQTLANLNIPTTVSFNAEDSLGNAYGQFTIDGAQVKIVSTDTLQDVFNAISTATNGAVTAALSNNQVVLTGHDTGSGLPQITVGSAADTTNFLEAMQLYTPSPDSTTGGQNVGATTTTGQTLSSLSLPTGITDGTFTVDGQSVSIAASTDTLQSVFSKISAATNGAVTGSLQNGSIVLSGTGALTLGNGSDTSNFLSALQLSTPSTSTVSSASGLGGMNVATALTNAVDASQLTGLNNGEGSFTINGETINYNVDTDSVRSLMNEINESGAGVLVNFDPSTSKLSIQNQATGTMGIAVSDSTGLLTQLGLTSSSPNGGAATSYGVNAQFTMNGGSNVMTSNSNTLSPDITGVPGLQVTANATGQDTMTVTADTTAATANINNFITAYNALNTSISTAEKTTINSDGSVTVSPLSGNTEVQNWLNQMRSDIFQSVNTGVSTVSALYQAGLDFDDNTGALSITNQTEFSNALSQNPAALAAIFNAPTDPTTGQGGVANMIYNQVTDITSPTGSLQTQINTNNTETQNLQADIATAETKISDDQAALTQGFENMETAISQTNNDMKIIQSITTVS